jgi:hypothetical protein
MKVEYKITNYKAKSPKNSNSFCVKNHLSDRTGPINIVLIGYDNQTIEESDKHQDGHGQPW